MAARGDASDNTPKLGGVKGDRVTRVAAALALHSSYLRWTTLEMTKHRTTVRQQEAKLIMKAECTCWRRSTGPSA